MNAHVNNLKVFSKHLPLTFTLLCNFTLLDLNLSLHIREKSIHIIFHFVLFSTLFHLSTLKRISLCQFVNFCHFVQLWIETLSLVSEGTGVLLLAVHVISVHHVNCSNLKFNTDQIYQFFYLIFNNFAPCQLFQSKI